MRTGPARRRKRQATIRAMVLAAFTTCVITTGILIAAALTDKPTTPQEATENAEQQGPGQEVGIITSEATEPSEAAPEAQERPEAQVSRYIYYNVPLADDLQEYTQDLCNEYGVQYELVLALMSAESGYRTDVISKTNDYGIMQINKINHERLTKTLGITDYLDPEQNIRAGIYMLSEIAENYDTPQEILMVYNRGHAGAKRLWKQGIITTKYTSRVLQRMDELEQRTGG